MRQSNNRKSRDVTAFLYERLSRDDNLEGESYSIGNQKKLLTKVAKEKGYTNLVHFLDDGISGVTMDRPGFNDMMEQLAAGKAAAQVAADHVDVRKETVHGHQRKAAVFLGAVLQQSVLVHRVFRLVQILPRRLLEFFGGETAVCVGTPLL